MLYTMLCCYFYASNKEKKSQANNNKRRSKGRERKIKAGGICCGEFMKSVSSTPHACSVVVFRFITCQYRLTLSDQLHNRKETRLHNLYCFFLSIKAIHRRQCEEITKSTCGRKVDLVPEASHYKPPCCANPNMGWLVL